jgi:hypothetical protein
VTSGFADESYVYGLRHRNILERARTLDLLGA